MLSLYSNTYPQVIWNLKFVNIFYFWVFFQRESFYYINDLSIRSAIKYNETCRLRNTQFCKNKLKNQIIIFTFKFDCLNWKVKDLLIFSTE